MKKSDLVLILVLAAIFTPLIACEEVNAAYGELIKQHGMLMGIAQYALFATIGEMLGHRFQTGKYYSKEFGLWPRAFVWGFLGLGIAMAIPIFGTGTPPLIDSLFYMEPGTISSLFTSPELSWLKVFGAFWMAFFMDVFFSPLVMIMFGVYDMHIKQTGGTLKGFFSQKVQYSANLQNANWTAQWRFVFMKTIPFFWIPAHTIMYLIPSEYMVLMSSMLNIVLGTILFFANKKN